MDFLQVCKASHSKIKKKEDAKSEKALFDPAALLMVLSCTAEHIAAIKKYGPCPAHRMTFIGKFL